MPMPDIILSATHDTLREQIDTYITPDGEPGIDALSVVCYTLERALQSCASGMSKDEYKALEHIANTINEAGTGNVKMAPSFDEARAVGRLIEDYTDALATGGDVDVLDFPELTDSEFAMCRAMAERRGGKKGNKRGRKNG